MKHVHGISHVHLKSPSNINCRISYYAFGRNNLHVSRNCQFGRPNQSFEMSPLRKTSDTNRSNKFAQIELSNARSLLKILKDRLPKSAHVYNSVLRFSKHSSEFLIYTLNGDISPSTWIIVVCAQIGSLKNKQQVSISAPENPQITNDIKQAFVDTDALNWNADIMFNAIDRPITPMLFEISWLVKRHATFCFPNYYYTIKTEDARGLEVSLFKEDAVELKPLDPCDGALFLTENWKYAVEDTLHYTKEIIRRHPSAGVYVNGKPVSGVVAHSNLLIGMLSTDTDHRNKGYALACYKTLLINLAKEGYVPASCAEQTNHASIKFHEKCGMYSSHECDYIESKAE